MQKKDLDWFQKWKRAWLEMFSLQSWVCDTSNAAELSTQVLSAFFARPRQKGATRVGLRGGSRGGSGGISKISQDGGNRPLPYKPHHPSPPLSTIIIVRLVCSSLKSYCLFSAKRRILLVEAEQLLASYWSVCATALLWLAGASPSGNLDWFRRRKQYLVVCMYRANIILQWVGPSSIE